MKKEFLTKTLPYLAVIVIFVLISVGYFLPDIFEGKTLFQHDIQQGVAMGAEVREHYARTGERTRWTNAMFGGMPAYQISPAYDSSQLFAQITKIYSLYLISPAGLLFSMLLGFFILMKAFRIRTDMAALGAILYTFSSYFLIIIKAGHIWKFTALAYIPPTIAGIVLIYNRKYLLGGITLALFLALQIMSNHVQMSYYFLFVIAALISYFLAVAIKRQKLAPFFISSTVSAAALVIAVAINIPSLYHTYEYSKETMRGKSELTIDNENDRKEAAPARQSIKDVWNKPLDAPTNGLARDYIVQWSYGIGETWTLLVPDAKGGSSGYLGSDKKAMERVPSQQAQIMAQMSRYWGNQPFTSGPVYVGAFVLFLFLFGMFIVRTNMKWPLLAVAVLAILLSWGENFMGLTNIFIDYFPMYSKFRAVSSILVIVEFVIPLIAILALKEIVENPEIIRKQKIGFWISVAFTLGTTFLFAVAPGAFFDFLSRMELEYANQYPQFNTIAAPLTEIRKDILSSDAWRSFFIILAGIALLYFFTKKKLSA
ncbi:MAG: hypothetical protein LBD45_08080, partial [Bacteroidales bacterium]|nr:hypothetical protein [Bacteroidales bacterium]